MGNCLRMVFRRQEFVMQEEIQPFGSQDQQFHSEIIPYQHVPGKEVCIKMKPEAIREEYRVYQKLMESQTWFLDFRFLHMECSYFLSLVDECKGVLTLKVITASHLPFDTNFFSIRFHDLQKLTLSDCNLESAEFIRDLDIPNLKQLNLCRNRLTNIRTLKKLIGQLQILNVRQNLITSLRDSQIQRINFAREIEGLNFEEDKEFYGDDFNWVFKLPCETFIRLQLNSRLRIVTNSKKAHKIMRRYKGKNGIFCWGPRTVKY